MGEIHRLSQVNPGLIARLTALRPADPDNPPYNTITVQDDEFERIGDYTRSQPTAPGAGRIYRKNLDWRPNTPDDWWLFVTEDIPDQPGWIRHIPYKVRLASDPLREDLVAIRGHLRKWAVSEYDV